MIGRLGVAYLLIDDDRYANVGPNLLGATWCGSRTAFAGLAGRPGAVVGVFEAPRGD